MIMHYFFNNFDFIILKIKSIYLNMEIILDPKIRDWVFIPIILVMFLVSIFRNYLTLIMNNRKKPDPLTT